MKHKILMLIAFATLGLTFATLAQVPNYVPTNGLVAFWPFNGNANDESGNGNNGTVNGATLTSDRNGNINSAYSFNGINFNHIAIPSDSSLDLVNDFSISCWFNSNLMYNQSSTVRSILMKGGDGVGMPNGYAYGIWGGITGTNSQVGVVNFQAQPYGTSITYPSNSSGLVMINNWYNYTVTYTKNDSTLKYYINNGLVDVKYLNFNIGYNTNPLWIGSQQSIYSTTKTFDGTLDDIGIWNRALSQQEITNLYNGVICGNNTNISPQNNSLATGSIATFNATTSDPNPSYVWQSNFGQGFQTLNNIGNYSGTNTNILSIANLQLAQHNLPIRVITTSGSCVDTSNVAKISITDTCINTINDTNYISVTDTLIINTNVTGINPPNNINTIKIFPNPASTYITIDYGNYTMMNGYQLKIMNSLGQQKFQTAINQQSSYINFASWSGSLYFVHIIDPQGNILDIRKIVLQ
jgi:hypothetical protein